MLYLYTHSCTVHSIGPSTSIQWLLHSTTTIVYTIILMRITTGHLTWLSFNWNPRDLHSHFHRATLEQAKERSPIFQSFLILARLCCVVAVFFLRLALHRYALLNSFSTRVLHVVWTVLGLFQDKNTGKKKKRSRSARRHRVSSVLSCSWRAKKRKRDKKKSNVSLSCVCFSFFPLSCQTLHTHTMGRWGGGVCTSILCICTVSTYCRNCQCLGL